LITQKGYIKLFIDESNLLHDKLKEKAEQAASYKKFINRNWKNILIT
jgi:hypothetical protein